MQLITTEIAAEALRQVELLAMDVDGVLTDGSVSLSSSGAEMRTFNVKDGIGLMLLHHAGVKIAWITGRRSDLVERRAAELGVDWLYQGVKNKRVTLDFLRHETKLSTEQVAYIGDDLNDIPAASSAAVSIAVADATTDLISVFPFVTSVAGGRGAVREVANAILDAKGIRSKVIHLYLESLESADGALQPAEFVGQ